LTRHVCQRQRTSSTSQTDSDSYIINYTTQQSSVDNIFLLYNNNYYYDKLMTGVIQQGTRNIINKLDWKIGLSGYRCEKNYYIVSIKFHCSLGNNE